MRNNLESIGAADFFYILQEVPELCDPFIDIAKELWNFRDERCREIIILRIASSISSSYELQHHLTIARNVGLTAYEIEAIIQGKFLEPYKKHENILLSTIDAIINKETLDKEKFLEYYTNNELQYVIAFVGFYSWLNYYTTALDLKVGQREW